MFEQFGINAWLLAAQIVNFGLVVFVLYKLAYKPILKVLDDRREKIENSLKQAEAVEHRTEELEKEVDAKLKKAKKEADAIVAEAREVAEKSRNDLMVKTNNEVTKMMEKAKQDIENQKERMMDDIKQYVVQTSLLVVEKILSEKLDKGTQEKLVQESLKEIPTQK